MASNRIGVALVVHPRDEAQAARVVEALSRIAASFAMEDTWCEMTLTPFVLIEEEIDSEDATE